MTVYLSQQLLDTYMYSKRRSLQVQISQVVSAYSALQFKSGHCFCYLTVTAMRFNVHLLVKKYTLTYLVQTKELFALFE